MLQNWRRSDFCQLRGCHGRSRQRLQWQRGFVIPTHASFLKKCCFFSGFQKDIGSVLGALRGRRRGKGAGKVGGKGKEKGREIAGRQVNVGNTLEIYFKKNKKLDCFFYRLLASPTTKVERMLLQESKDLSEVLFPSLVDALRVARNSSMSSSMSFARTEFEAEEGGKEAEPDDSGLSRYKIEFEKALIWLPYVNKNLGEIFECIFAK